MAILKSGLLIALEGIDGSGKTTLAKHLNFALKNAGHSVILTKEPGGTVLGKELRTILQIQKTPVTAQAEFLLFAADRAQHFAHLIIPALEKKQIVISDRLSDSSVVYQGYGRGLDISIIQTINRWVMHNLEPNIVFYLRIPFETSAERLKSRTELTAFEKEKKTFTLKLIEGFDELFKNKKNSYILDGTLSPEDITKQALIYIESWIKQNS